MTPETERRRKLEPETQAETRLEGWYVGEDDCLYGVIYGHPKLPDGYPVRTSRMVSFDPSTGKAKTRNTNYTLGKPLATALLNAKTEGK